MGKHRYGIANGTFTIDNGQTLSNGIEVPNNVTHVALFFPVSWTAGDIYLDVSIDGGTVWAVAQCPCTSNARKCLESMPHGDGVGVHFDVSEWLAAILHTNPPDGTLPVLRIRSSVAQAAERLIYIIYDS